MALIKEIYILKYQLLGLLLNRKIGENFFMIVCFYVLQLVEYCGFIQLKTDWNKSLVAKHYSLYWIPIFYLYENILMKYLYWLNIGFTLQMFALLQKIRMYIRNICNRTSIFQKYFILFENIRRETPKYFRL